MTEFNLLFKYLKLIYEEKPFYFDFLQDELSGVIGLQEALKDRNMFEDASKSKSKTDHNAIFDYERNCETPLDKHQWNAIYEHNLLALKNVKANPTQKISVYSYENSIDFYCKKAIDSIFKTKNQTNSLIHSLLESDENLRENLTMAISTTLTDMCYTVHTRNKTNTIISLKYTDCAFTFGLIFLQLYGIKRPKIFRLIKDLVLNNISYNDKFSKMHHKDTELLNRIFLALSTENKEMFDEICIKDLNIANNDLKQIKFLKIIFKNLMLENLNECCIVEQNILTAVEKYFIKEKVKKDTTFDYKKTLLDLGNIVCESLIVPNKIEIAAFQYKTKPYSLEIKDPILIENMLNRSHYIKPAFTKANIDDLEKNRMARLKNDQNNENKEKDQNFAKYTKFMQQYVRKIHGHSAIKIKLKDPKIVNELKYTKFTINRKALRYLLQELEKLYKSFDGISVKRYYESLLDINTTSYDYDESFDPEYKRVYPLILCMGFDLNNHMCNDFYQDLKKGPQFKGKEKLIKLFDLIRIRKVYLINLLKESLYLSSFKYFMHASFWDARLRGYMLANYTNIHNFKLSNLMCSLYQKNKSNLKIKTRLKPLLDVIKNKKVRSMLRLDIYSKTDNQLDALTLDCYKNELRKYFKNISDIDLNRLLSIKNYDELLIEIEKKLKKAKDLYLTSFSILHLQNVMEGTADPHLAVRYGLDATCSGLQMLSILFRRKTLGVLCNLMGTEKQDIYSLSSAHLKAHLKDISLYFKFYNKDNNLNEFLLEFKKTKLICGLALVLKLCYKVKEHLEHLGIAPTIKVEGCDNTLEELFNLYATKTQQIWLKTLLRKGDENDVIPYYKLLVVLLIQFKLNNFTYQQKQDLVDRQVYKDAVMTSFYNSTVYGRRWKFKEYLIEKGFPNNQSINFLLGLLENCFQDYMNKNVKERLLLKDLTDILAKKKCAINVVNPLCHMVYNYKKTSNIKMQTKTASKKRGRQLIVKVPIHNVFDEKKFNQSFPANLIHSLDAYIAHCVRRTINKLNSGANAKINYTINHDNFMCTEPLALRYIVADAYHSLYDLNYLTTIKELTKEELKSFLPPEALNLDLNINANFIK